MHVVEEFLRSWKCLSERKNPLLIFCEVTKLEVAVLQVQISQVNFVNYFFAKLWVDWYPVEFGFFDDFVAIFVVSGTETHSVRINQHKFPLNPLVYICRRFTDRSRSWVIASFKEEDKLAGKLWAVITLEWYCGYIKTFELLIVETKPHLWCSLLHEELTGRICKVIYLKFGLRAISNWNLLKCNTSWNDSPTFKVWLEDAVTCIFNWLGVSVIGRETKGKLEVLVRYVVHIEVIISLAYHQVCLIEVYQLNLLHGSVKYQNGYENHRQAAALLRIVVLLPFRQPKSESCAKGVDPCNFLRKLSTWIRRSPLMHFLNNKN